MEKKPFLLVLPVCLVFCLLLASCDDDYKKESVPGLWEKIRNTAWKMEKIVKDGGEEYHVTYTIGFYGPDNGPFPQHYSSDQDYLYYEKPAPYAVIRVFSNDAPGNSAGRYYFTQFSRLKISRTGDKILESYPDYDYDKLNKYYKENYGHEYYKPDWDLSSFNISVSGDGATLTISSAKMAGNTIEGGSTGSTDDAMDNRIRNNINKINGTYSKIPDPDYNFDEGRQELWSQIKNTAWKKPGDSTPSVGFYEGDKGPSPRWRDYAYFITPDGNAPLELSSANRDWVYIEAEGVTFNISVTNNGNTLTISNISQGHYSDDGRPFSGYDDEIISAFNGTYTKYSSDPDYAFNEGWELLWSKIKNTAWTKQGSSTPSVGFYELGKGPESNYTNDSYDDEDAEQYYGYVSFITPDGIASRYLYKSSNKNEFFIDANGLTFRITVSGDTLTISNINPPYSGYERKLGFYSDSGFIRYYYDYYNYQPTATAEYNKEELGRYFNGTYTKASSDPDFNFDEGRKQLWSQIKNTAWTKQGDSKPSVGFYEGGKGPSSWYSYDGYVYFKRSDSYYDSIPLTIYKDNDYNNNPNVSRNGDTITHSYPSYNIVDIVFNIAVSGDTLTISNVRLREGYDYDGNLSNYIGLNGTYTKASSDPDYSWD